MKCLGEIWFQMQKRHWLCHLASSLTLAMHWVRGLRELLFFRSEMNGTCSLFLGSCQLGTYSRYRLPNANVQSDILPSVTN